MEKYKIIHERDLYSLECKVSDLMKEGWKCQGGVSFFYYPPEQFPSGNISYNKNIWHTQAMIKSTT